MTIANLEFQARDGEALLAYVPGDRAAAKWKEIADLHPTTGYWPLLIGSPEAVKEAVECRADLASDEPDTTDPAAIDLDTWFAERLEMVTGADEDDPEDEPLGTEWLEIDVEALVSQDELEELDDTPSAVTDDEFEPLPSVGIALVKADRPADILLDRPFGGWNDCPSDAELVAILRRWEDRYGVRLMSITHDSMELHRSSPVADPDLAVTIAKEVAIVAPDIVLQGTETAQVLAEELMSRPHWFLWWD